MNNINPQNYVGATLSLTGYVAVEPRYPAYDKNGSRGFKQIPVAINEGYKPKDGGDFVKTGTTWYDIEVREEVIDDLDIRKGDKIRIDGAKQEVREYQDRDGNTKLGITLKFGDLVVLEAANNPASESDYSDDTPF